MTVLSVNLNKVALLRNQRELTYPDILDMARTTIGAGARGITVHPRPDERHIRRTDVFNLAQMLRSEYPGTIEFNIEGYPTEGFLELVEAVHPDQVTLVPDAPEQNTSDHGWDIPANMDLLCLTIERLHKIGARVSLFIDDDPSLAEPARATGTDRVELYTGPYHSAFVEGRGLQAIKSFAATAQAMREVGIGLNAGHDLNLDNLADFLTGIPFIKEVSIGHAITVDALRMGMDAATRSYVKITDNIVS